MRIFKPVQEFRDDHSGAVTVDWVVLTSAVVVLGIAVISVIRTGADTSATRVNNAMTTLLTNY